MNNPAPFEKLLEEDMGTQGLPRLLNFCQYVCTKCFTNYTHNNLVFLSYLNNNKPEIVLIYWRNARICFMFVNAGQYIMLLSI